MEAALKDAKCDIIIAGYDIDTTVWKDLRSNPRKEAMLRYSRCHYNPTAIRRRFSKIGS